MADCISVSARCQDAAIGNRDEIELADMGIIIIVRLLAYVAI
ncbi:MAG: hypothetical protein Q8J63_07420 [Candidatus Aquicultor sp.]|nr:hypothetical protein [Candidatus Aquicultor sp.]